MKNTYPWPQKGFFEDNDFEKKYPAKELI